MPVVTGSAVTVFAGAAASARQRGMERVAGSLQAGEGLLPGAPVDAALERGAVRAAGAAQAAGGLPPGEPVDVALERGATQFPAVRAAADVADPAVPGGSVTGPGSEDCAALPGAVAPPRTSDGQGAEAGGLSASSAMALGGEVRRTAAPGTLRGRGREAASEGAAGLRSGPSLLVPASPSVSARECAFCADEPCELHAGAPVVPARSAGLGLAGEAMMRLRALEAESLLFETDQSIAALKGEALSSEARLAAVLGVAEVRTAGARAATHGTKGPGLEAEDAAPAGDEAAPSRTSGISPPTHRAGAGALTPPVAEGASVRKSMGPAVTAAGAAPRKTLGRAHTPRATESAAQHGKAPLRAQLAQKLAAHLAGALSAAELAAFAREGWMAQGDDAALESALRQLMFQDRPGAALDVDALVSLLASLQ